MVLKFVSTFQLYNYIHHYNFGLLDYYLYQTSNFMPSNQNGGVIDFNTALVLIICKQMFFMSVICKLTQIFMWINFHTVWPDSARVNIYSTTITVVTHYYNISIALFHSEVL